MADSKGLATPPAVSVVIPAYRESENLSSLTQRIDATCRRAGLTYEAIVVDDDSRDGTTQICAALARDFPLTLVVRKGERGLSSAVIKGLDCARSEIFVVMDADLSHPPEAIPKLVSGLDAGHEFVLGSRYVQGGSTDAAWGLLRWLNSRVATVLARPLTSVRDPMSGFFALRRETYARAKRLRPLGYKIGLELLVKCECKTVAEVPIHFAERVHGDSKLTLREQMRYLRHLLRLYAFELRRRFQRRRKDRRPREASTSRETACLLDGSHPREEVSGSVRGRGAP